MQRCRVIWIDAFHAWRRELTLLLPHEGIGPAGTTDFAAVARIRPFDLGGSRRRFALFAQGGANFLGNRLRCGGRICSEWARGCRRLRMNGSGHQQDEAGRNNAESKANRQSHVSLLVLETIKPHPTQQPYRSASLTLKKSSRKRGFRGPFDERRRGHFTSFLPVSFSRLPCMMALYLAFGILRPSKIFSVSRM
jgi:hypothetical protein